MLLPGNTPLASALPLQLAPGASVLVNLTTMAMAYAVVELEAAAAGAQVHLEYALRYRNNTPGETYGVGSSYTARAGRQAFIGADQWCAHYVKITCGTSNVTITGVSFVNRGYPFARLGSFTADGDYTLTTLWERAVNTIVAVTDDAYGSDARERNEWLQDPAEPNFITTRVSTRGRGAGLMPGEIESIVFGLTAGQLQVALAGPPLPGAGPDAPPVYSDPRPLKNLLRHAALSQQPDGRILATFPTDRGPSDCHWCDRWKDARSPSAILAFYC